MKYIYSILSFAVITTFSCNNHGNFADNKDNSNKVFYNIDTAIYNLPFVQKLSCNISSQSDVSKLASSLSDFIHLNYLEILFNGNVTFDFEILFKAIQKNKSIKILKIEAGNNSLSSIILNNSNIEELLINTNQEFSIDSNINDAASLKFLTIRASQLHLVSSIQNLDSIIQIDFSNCNMTSISENLNNLNLSSLVLDNNNISEIPTFFATMKNLKFVSLQNNKINNLSNSICNLKNLKEIRLYNNPLSYRPVHSRINKFNQKAYSLECLPNCEFLFSKVAESSCGGIK